jgi:hypothetical protein
MRVYFDSNEKWVKGVKIVETKKSKMRSKPKALMTPIFF